MLIGQAEVGHGRADVRSQRLDVDGWSGGLLRGARAGDRQDGERGDQGEAKTVVHASLIPDASNLFRRAEVKGDGCREV